MYYAIKRNKDDSIAIQKKFKTFNEAAQYCINNDFDEVITKDRNGYILETLYGGWR